MITVRHAQERGHAQHGWLTTWHSFSFADYYDPRFMGFSALRVINEDIVAAQQGFPMHPHKDMEILTYVLSGAVEHQDSMGNVGRINRGEFQIMSAGTGIRHSEYNPSPSEPLHLYQIWILPAQQGLKPRYEQKVFPHKQAQQLILSPDGRDNSLKVFQDMSLWHWTLEAGELAEYKSLGDRPVWIQIVSGHVLINQLAASRSDGIAIQNEPYLQIQATEQSEILIFDLPPI